MLINRQGNKQTVSQYRHGEMSLSSAQLEESSTAQSFTIHDPCPVIPGLKSQNPEIIF